MGEFIENRSEIGDVIVMVVRGGSKLHTKNDNSEIKKTLRKIGLDELTGCIDTYHDGFTCSKIQILSI